MARAGIAWVGAAIAIAGCARSAPPPPASASATKPTGSCSPQLPERCEAACFAGDGHACWTYGLAVEGTSDAPVRLKENRTRGRRALEHGCHQLDNLDACAEIFDYDYDYVANSNFAACDGWLQLCARGNTRSCAFGSDCLLYEPGYPKDVERALALLRAGCEKQDAVSCRELGALHEKGVYVDASIPFAFANLKKACALDDQLACAHLGRFYEKGLGTQADVAAAKPLYRAACARGIKRLPCEALARLGEEPPPIVER